MSVGGTTRLLSPEEIAVKAGEQAPFLRLPEPASVFADRALRLRQLAAGHAMRDFLVFMADLADAQQAVLATMPQLALPDVAALLEAARSGQPPLPANAGVRDAAWHGVLTGLLDRLRQRLPAGAARDVVQALAATAAEQLDRQAERLLGGVMIGLDLGAAPLIAAALQVCWTHRVLELQRGYDTAVGEAPAVQPRQAPFGRIDDATLCPCCGSRPTSSVTRIGADASGYRYLNCSLCSTQWHMVRIKCAHCQTTKGIQYEQLEAVPGRTNSAMAASAPPPGAVQAEICSECNHYLKIVHMGKDVHVEPVADDLASLTLDLLVSDAGVQRHGVNLLLLFGDPDDSTDQHAGADPPGGAVMDAPDGSMVHGSPAAPVDPVDPAGDAAAVAAARPADLPSIDRLLRLPATAALVAEHGHTLVTSAARELTDALRRQAVAGTLPASALQADALSGAIAGRVDERLAPRLRPVLNLTGTVIHTNLGRSPLCDAAVAQLVATAASPNNLEYDLESGGRGDRDGIVEDLLCTLTGAEAATVVNNNAAAVLLTIGALAASHGGGREVIVSRGELVEIGGAFRMPDVMAAAGATLVEVGTTNRTHPHDYERAIGERTALLMKVHTSNYTVQGFTAAVDEATLAPIARAHGLPLATDLGSGALIDLAAYGLPAEPLAQRMLAAGCDVVTFSGDKLLGGPQAGLIVGSRAAISRIRRFPLKRALRISKLPLAALEATLALYLRPERLARDLPTLRLLTRPLAAIQALATALAPAVAAAVAPRFAVEVAALSGQIGSGSLPVERLPSAGLALRPLAGRPAGQAPARAAAARAKGTGSALDELARALRSLAVPVIGRIADDRLLLDLRCLEDGAPLLAQLPALRERLGLPPCPALPLPGGDGRTPADGPP